MNQEKKPYEMVLYAEELKKQGKDLRKSGYSVSSTSGGNTSVPEEKRKFFISKYPEINFLFGDCIYIYKSKDSANVKRTLSVVQKYILEYEERLLNGVEEDKVYMQKCTRPLDYYTLKEVVGYWFYGGMGGVESYRPLNNIFFMYLAGKLLNND